MPLSVENTYHDRPSAQNLSTQTVTLAEGWKVLDLDQPFILIGQLNQPADYESVSGMILSVSVANTVVSFQLVINGTPAGSIRTARIKTNSTDKNYTFFGDTSDFSAGDEVTGRWMTDKGTVTMEELTIKLHGIACSRLVSEC